MKYFKMKNSDSKTDVTAVSVQFKNLEFYIKNDLVKDKTLQEQINGRLTTSDFEDYEYVTFIDSKVVSFFKNETIIPDLNIVSMQSKELIEKEIEELDNRIEQANPIHVYGVSMWRAGMLGDNDTFETMKKPLEHRKEDLTSYLIENSKTKSETVTKSAAKTKKLTNKELVG